MINVMKILSILWLIIGLFVLVQGCTRPQGTKPEETRIQRLRIVNINVPDVVVLGEGFNVSVTAQDPVGIKAIEITFLKQSIELPARSETTSVLNTTLSAEVSGYIELEAVAVGVDNTRGEPKSITIGVADDRIAYDDAIHKDLDIDMEGFRDLGVNPFELYRRGDIYRSSTLELEEEVLIQRKKDYEFDTTMITQVDDSIVALLKWWKSWNASGGPQPFDWQNHCNPNITGIEKDGKVLNCWLDLNPQVKQAMVWQEVDFTTGDVQLLTYDNWDPFIKNYLNVNFYYYWQWLSGNLSNFGGITLHDPPFNKVQLEDGNPAMTVLSRYQAANLYIQIVAHSLALEIGGFVPWSVLSYNQNDLQRIFSSVTLFNAGHYLSVNANGQIVMDFIGYWPPEVTPAPPTTTFVFLVDNVLRPSHYDTVSRLLKWGRENMYHYGGFSTAENMYAHWQYRGAPPVSLIIKGTKIINSFGVQASKAQSWAAGCHGTSFFFKEALRAVNIPVAPTWVPMTGGGGHRSPVFTTIGSTLSHGDDVYTVRINIPSVDPDYLPPDQLLIDTLTFYAWFNPNNPKWWKNVGRQPHEISLDILPNKLMDKYCDDLGANKSHAASSVYYTFDNIYTVQELEAMNLWGKLSAKNFKHNFCAEYYINADIVTQLFQKGF